MDHTESGPAAAWRRLRLLVLPVAMAAVVTLVVIQESRFQGRLAAPPMYDDVAYMRDGVGRLQVFYQGGVRELAGDIWKGPPHAPLQSAMAATGFALFGMVNWAPYVMNVLVALLLLALPAYLFRRSQWTHRGMLLLAMVALPVTVNSVHEFRPDITAATLIAWGMALVLDPPGGLGPLGRPLLVGGVFGLSLLAKTSTSPVTAALFGIAALTSGLMHGVKRDQQWKIEGAGLLREVSLATFALVAVAGWFYALSWEKIYYYIYVNMFGERADMWKRSGGLGYHVRYYVDGEGGWFMLGQGAYPLLVLTAVGAVLGVVRPPAGWRSRIGMGGLFVAMMLAYAVCTWNPMKQGFLGLPFQLLLLLAGLLSLRSLLAVLHEQWEWARLSVLAAAAMCSVGYFRFINLWPVGQPSFRAGNVFYDEAYAAIRRELGSQPAVVLVTFTGMVNETNLEYRAHVDAMPFYGMSREEAKTVEDYEPFVLKASLVLAAQSGTGMTDDSFPSGALHDAMIERLETKGDFRRVWKWPSVTPGREFRLYRRVKKPEQPEQGGAQSQP